MPTITIDTTGPQVAFITWMPVTAATVGTIIPTAAPQSIRVLAGATFTLGTGVYELRYDGIAGLGTTYVRTTVDCTDTVLRTAHAIDPATLLPAPPPETVEDALDEIRDQLLHVTPNGDGGATITTLGA